MHYSDWALIVPMANEENDFVPFINEVAGVLDQLSTGTVYLIVDRVSTDNTCGLCKELSAKDRRFITVWAPENNNVVDAYLRGYREASLNNHRYILEIDAGLSHDPKLIPLFLQALENGNECAFGSRFIKNGSMSDSNPGRYFLSKAGTILSNLLLGTHMKDMTSGFQGFHIHIVREFLKYKFHSKAHFYQTELRFLLRNRKSVELPISYKAPSPNVSFMSILNSLFVLGYYFARRLVFISASI